MNRDRAKDEICLCPSLNSVGPLILLRVRSGRNDETRGISSSRYRGRLFSRRNGGYPVAMVDKVLLSSLRRGRYVLRAFCTKAECNSSWDVDIAQAEQTLGDISFTELRRRLRCPQCDAPISTTLTSLK